MIYQTKIFWKWLFCLFLVLTQLSCEDKKDSNSEDPPEEETATQITETEKEETAGGENTEEIKIGPNQEFLLHKPLNSFKELPIVLTWTSLVGSRHYDSFISNLKDCSDLVQEKKGHLEPNYTIEEISDGIYYLCVTAHKEEQPIIAVNNGMRFEIDRSRPTAQLSTEPDLYAKSQSLNVVGEDVATYRMQFGLAGSMDCNKKEAYSESLSIATPINVQIEFGTDGYSLCIVGEDEAGNVQRFSEATVVTWNPLERGYSFDFTNPKIFTSTNASGDKVQVTANAHSAWKTPTAVKASVMEMSTALCLNNSLNAIDAACPNLIDLGNTTTIDLRISKSALTFSRRYRVNIFAQKDANMESAHAGESDFFYQASFLQLATGGNNEAHTSFIHPSGDVLVAGIFKGSMTVAGKTITSPPEDSWGFYAMRMGADGRGKWLDGFGCNGSKDIYEASMDSKGDLYFVGYSTCDLEIADDSFVAGGSRDTILVKYSGETGEVLWSRFIGTSNNDTPGSVFVDAADRVYLYGRSCGTFPISSTLTYPKGCGIFVIRYASNGTPEWYTKTGLQTGSYPWHGDISKDGKILIAGRFNTKIQFGDTLHEATNDKRNGFVALMNPDGTIDWSQILSSDGDLTARVAKFDASGNVFVTGYVAEGTSLTSGGQTVNPTGLGDKNYFAYWTKFDASGNLLWNKTLGVNGSQGYASDIEVVGNRLISLALFNGTTVVGETTYESGSRDLVLVMLSTSTGAFEHFENLGTKYWDFSAWPHISKHPQGGVVFPIAYRTTHEIFGESFKRIGTRDVLIREIVEEQPNLVP